MKKFDYLCLIYSVLLLIFGFDDEPKRVKVPAQSQPVQEIVMAGSAVHASLGEAPNNQIASNTPEPRRPPKTKIVQAKF